MRAGAAAWSVRGTLLVGLAGVLVGCASGVPSPPDVSAGGRPAADLLDTYRALDLVVGNPDLPVVGRFVIVRGPADSAYVGFAASMPPASLRFAREGDLFSASYQVRLTFLSGRDTVRAVNRREIVRVEDFSETARTDEAIVFQRFVTLPPGEYTVDVLVRELTTRNQATSRYSLAVPAFGASGATLSPPLVAYRAAPRREYAQPPPMIISPRSTAVYGRAPAVVVIEDYAPGSAGFLVRAFVGEERVWEDTLRGRVAEQGPATAIAPLPLQLLPPGLARIEVQALDDGRSSRATLLVGLADQWVFGDFEEATEHLRYAVPPETLEAWREAGPAERSRLWGRFWTESDPDPKTPANEFLAEYFDRMTKANRRYGDSRTPGWRSDRGRALVQLGEPDKEVLRAPRRTGERAQIEWLYEESLPIRVRLLFEDVSGFGTFVLTQRSRLLLREAAEQLRRHRAEQRESLPGQDDT